MLVPLGAASGRPDDSREEDERQEQRRLRDLRGRVKVARALISTAKGLAAVLGSDPARSAEFHRRRGVSIEQIRDGVRLAPVT